MGYRIRTVDVFTDRQLAGNQLAVVLGADGLSDRAMQDFAREMNISETTFVMPPEDAGHAARVRIFTPADELPFAGHPTLGTAWVIWDEGMVSGAADELTLGENIGPIRVRREGVGADALLWMTTPPVTFGEVFDDRAAIAGALGLSENDLHPKVPVRVAATGVPYVYVGCTDATVVDRAAADARALRDALAGREPMPVFIFAPAGRNRLYSRMFAPHLGTPEDPATGSASGPLAALAVACGLVDRADKVSIVSEQGTQMRRQSFIHVRLEYGASHELPERIEVGGSVVPVLAGELSDGAL
jgi:trans-2,3-dihydro-3-hydroxyanthranilate isomerase